MAQPKRRDEGHAALGSRRGRGSPAGAVPRNGELARGETIAAGLVVDGVPESIALGLTVAEGEVGLALLAGILVGNIVEAYGAAQPIIAGGRSKRFTLVLLAGIGATLAVATVLGGVLLSEASDSLVGSAEAIAAGALLG
jgi:ZIP family zinc transporter